MTESTKKAIYETHESIERMAKITRREALRETYKAILDKQVTIVKFLEDRRYAKSIAKNMHDKRSLTVHGIKDTTLGES